MLPRKCLLCQHVAAQDLVLPLLHSFEGIFNLPVCISAATDHEQLSFESIQLSTQGAERQRKDVGVSIASDIW